jgi:hypothetical protein
MEEVESFEILRMFNQFVRSEGMSILDQGNHESFLDALGSALDPSLTVPRYISF